MMSGLCVYLASASDAAIMPYLMKGERRDQLVSSPAGGLTCDRSTTAAIWAAQHIHRFNIGST